MFLVLLFWIFNLLILQSSVDFFHAKNIVEDEVFESQFFVRVYDPSLEGFVSSIIGPFDLSEAVIVVDRDDTLINVETFRRINRTNICNLIDQAIVNSAPVYVLSAASFCPIVHNKFLDLFNFFLNCSNNPGLATLVRAMGGQLLNSIIYTNRYGHEPGVRSPNKEPFLKLISDCCPQKMIYFFDNDFCYCQEVLNQYRRLERTYSLAVFWLPVFNDSGVIGWIKPGYNDCLYLPEWQLFASRLGLGRYIDDIMYRVDDYGDESNSDLLEELDVCEGLPNLLRLNCSD